MVPPGGLNVCVCACVRVCLQSRLVVKTSLKLLIVFVEYSEANSPLLIDAVNTVDEKRGTHTHTHTHTHTRVSDVFRIRFIAE